MHMISKDSLAWRPPSPDSVCREPSALIAASGKTGAGTPSRLGLAVSPELGETLHGHFSHVGFLTQPGTEESIKPPGLFSVAPPISLCLPEMSTPDFCF